MRAKEMALKTSGSPLRQCGDRDPRRVRADDRVGAAMWFKPLEQLLLDVEPLDDCLEDPVALRDAREIFVEAASSYQGVRRRCEERVWFDRPGSLEPFTSRVAGDVEQ